MKYSEVLVVYSPHPFKITALATTDKVKIS